MSINRLDVLPNQPEPSPPLASPRLRPRRTLNRFALALAGVGVGALAQFFFSQQSLWDGLIFYAIAVVLFIRALATSANQVDPILPQNSYLSSFFSQLHPGWRRNMSIWLMILALGISAVAFRLFDTEDANPQTWWLYPVSLMLWAGGGLLLTKGAGWRSQLQQLLPNQPIIAGLALVVGLALLMRLFNFNSQPFGIWYDEAEAGLQARRMLTDPSYRPLFYPPINITGHLLALYALALNWLGDDIHSMRLVSVLFGLGAVVSAYGLGQEIRGSRFGLLLAFLVAVARWHVNFSRIAMTGIDAPFFELLSLFFVVRLLKRGQARDALWAGLSLGFGLMFYTAFRLYVLALLLFVIAACLLGVFDPTWRRWWVANLQKSTWLAHLSVLLLLLAGIWVVMMPLAKAAALDPDGFWYRTNQISIFTRRDQPDLLKAVWESGTKHLLMFNFKGDGNGRHNLPGEPMLDPVMAVLAVLGLGLALLHFRRPANLFFLLLFITALAGGILSVDFEAPQSLRAIAVIPAVLYFVALALVTLGQEALAALKPLPRPWLITPAVALLGLILGLNAYTYFVRQANDFASWNAFSTPETVAARKMAELGPSYRFFLSPFLAAHPTLRFVAPTITDQRGLTLPDALPVREPAERPVALLIHPDDVWVFNEAQRLYPGAKFEIASSHTDDATPIIYFVELQPVNLAAVQGLELRYYPDSPPEDEALPPALHTERSLSLQADWPANLPPELLKTANESQDQTAFKAVWSGVLYAPRYGPYSLHLTTPATATLEIDGNTILQGKGEQLTGLPLAQGNHSIRVEAQVAPGKVALLWQPPGQSETALPTWAMYVPPIQNHGLLGTFYANDRWQGQPALQRIDPFLDTYYHFTPLPRPYSVEWSGSLDVPQSGVYRLGLKAVPEAQLEVDGNLLVSTLMPNEFIDASITLQAGLHELRLRFKDNTDRSRIHLYWTLPSGPFEPIPSQFLWPPLGKYPPRPAPPPSPVQFSNLNLNWLASLGGPGNQPGRFFEPRDVAVLGDGTLAVADTGNRQVQLLRFSPERGLDLQEVQVLTGDDFPFEEPLAVVANSQDQILVLDSTLQWVYRYDRLGNFIDRFGGPTAFLFHPRGMSLFSDDSLAIADTGGARLALFDQEGVPAGSIGGLGNGPGQFSEPTDVLRDEQGTYFVAEAENNRIQRLDAGGSPLAQWAIPDSYGYNGPHLAFGPDGSIFVTEAQSRSLLRYAPDGNLLDQWQTIGPVTFTAPVGIYFDAPTNRLFVTDVMSHQVYVFEVQTGPQP
jgi:hypothetical protein